MKYIVRIWICVFVCLSIILYRMITILPLPPCFKSLEIVIFDVLSNGRICVCFTITFVLKAFHISPFSHLTQILSRKKWRGQVGTPADSTGCFRKSFGINTVSISLFLSFLNHVFSLGRLLIDEYL